jgi:hypothetical protein
MPLIKQLLQRSKDLIVRFNFLNTCVLVPTICVGVIFISLKLNLNLNLILFFIVFSLSFILTNLLLSRKNSDSYKESFLYFQLAFLNILAALFGIIIFFLIIKYFCLNKLLEDIIVEGKFPINWMAPDDTNQSKELIQMNVENTGGKKRYEFHLDKEGTDKALNTLIDAGK